MVCAHGGASDAAELHDRVRTLAQAGRFAPCLGAFLYGEPKLEAVIAQLNGSPLRVVPLFMAEGVTFAALQARLERLPNRRRALLCRPVGSHPELPRRLAADAARAVRALGWSARETGLVLVGHGSLRSTASQRATARLAQAVAWLGRFAEVGTAVLEAGSTLDEAIQAMAVRRVAVVGCFAERGNHALGDLPALVSRLRREVVYLGPVGAAPWITDLILDLADCAAPAPCPAERRDNTGEAVERWLSP